MTHKLAATLIGPKRIACSIYRYVFFIYKIDERLPKITIELKRLYGRKLLDALIP